VNTKIYIVVRYIMIANTLIAAYRFLGKEVMDMAVETISHAPFHEHARQWENTTLRTELLLACGVVVLSILGLAGVFRNDLAAIAVIGLGVVLGCQGANVVLRYTELLYEAGATANARSAEVSRGITAEFLAGVAGIVLGILALLQVVPMTLMSAAVITYGGTLLLTSSESVWVTPLGKENELVQQLMRSMGTAVAGAQVLVGLAAVVLGILGLVSIVPITMILVALLAIGASMLLRSSFVGGFLLDFLRM
jgi:hypothetical protein